MKIPPSNQPQPKVTKPSVQPSPQKKPLPKLSPKVAPVALPKPRSKKLPVVPLKPAVLQASLKDRKVELTTIQPNPNKKPLPKPLPKKV